MLVKIESTCGCGFYSVEEYKGELPEHRFTYGYCCPECGYTMDTEYSPSRVLFEREEFMRAYDEWCDYLNGPLALPPHNKREGFLEFDKEEFLQFFDLVSHDYPWAWMPEEVR